MTSFAKGHGEGHNFLLDDAVNRLNGIRNIDDGPAIRQAAEAQLEHYKTQNPGGFITMCGVELVFTPENL